MPRGVPSTSNIAPATATLSARLLVTPRDISVVQAGSCFCSPQISCLAGTGSAIVDINHGTRALQEGKASPIHPCLPRAGPSRASLELLLGSSRSLKRRFSAASNARLAPVPYRVQALAGSSPSIHFFVHFPSTSPVSLAVHRATCLLPCQSINCSPCPLVSP